MRRIVFFIVVCFAFVLMGCLSSQSGRAVKDEQEDISDNRAMVDDDLPKTIQYTFLDTVNRGKELVLTDSDFSSETDLGTSGETGTDGVKENRFRIQVFASNRIETIREQKKELEKKITERVDMGYDAPYYKLYTGSFVKRQDAQPLLKKLKALGYVDAWVVSSGVISEN